MKQLVILSGKGGTGKTTIATALSEIAENKVMADCDVEAPNLNIIFNGEIQKVDNFYGKEVALIDEEKCIKCGLCETLCRFDAISDYKVNPYHCEGCGLCSYKCPSGAIKMIEENTGEIIVGENKKGEKIIYAELFPGADGSGKLVTEVRKKATENKGDCDYIIIDGTPGIGCPVLSSATGADVALIVTEPTVSGFEDMKRVLEAIESFKIKSLVCINKWDINKDISNKIEKYCQENNIDVVGKINFDETVIKALKRFQSINKYPDSIVYRQILDMWEKIKKYLDERIDA